MNSKSRFVVALVCGILLAALAARNGSLLVLAAPFMVYLIVGLLHAPASPSLTAERALSASQVVARQPIEVCLTVHNHGSRLANVHLLDPLPAGVSLVDGRAGQVLALESGQHATLLYRIVAERGAYEWASILARAVDPFGLFETAQHIPAPGNLLVHPPSLSIHRLSFKPRSTLHAPGQVASRLPGVGTDFWGVREYRPGDPLRRLNWRLAGRYPRRRFTNEYEGQEIADFGLILDARRLTDAHALESALFESSVSAAASLAGSLLGSGNRLALLIFGRDPTYLFPGYGKRQLDLVMRALSRASLGPGISLRYLEYFPLRLFPRRSVILAFSAIDSRDLESYARLHAWGYDVLLVSPDPVDYVRRALPPGEINDLALRLARLERVVHLKRLLQRGIGVVDWQVDQPLDVLLQRTAAGMLRRRAL